MPNKEGHEDGGGEGGGGAAYTDIIMQNKLAEAEAWTDRCGGSLLNSLLTAAARHLRTALNAMVRAAHGSNLTGSTATDPGMIFYGSPFAPGAIGDTEAGGKEQQWVDMEGAIEKAALEFGGVELEVESFATFSESYIGKAESFAQAIADKAAAFTEAVGQKLDFVVFAAESYATKGPSIGGYTARQVLDAIAPYLKEGAEITICSCGCDGEAWQKVADRYVRDWRVSSMSTPDTCYYPPSGSVSAVLTEGYQQWLNRNKYR
jgi:hypothetical protein